VRVTTADWARRPSAGAMPGRCGCRLAAAPHWPVTELGFALWLSTFFAVGAMVATPIAIVIIVIEDGAKALAVPDNGVDGAGQIDEEGLVGLDLRVALDRDGDGLAGLARRERQGPGRGFVVVTRPGRAVRGAVADGDRPGCGFRQRDGEDGIDRAVVAFHNANVGE